MLKNRMAQVDMGLFAAVLLLLGFGIVLVYSSSFAVAEHKFGGADFFLVRQSVRALLALTGFMLFINIDYHVWGKLGNLIYVFALVLLGIVLLLPDTSVVNGAKRWLSIGPISFQVSDFARMALILVIARNCENAGSQIREWKVFAKNCILIGIVCGMILLEPNFSTALILGTIGLSMLFLSGAKFAHIASLALTFVPIAIYLVLGTPYRRARWLGYVNMAEKKESIGYQAYQSLIGLGNGGLFGVGLGKGEQKFFYLPEPHTDFAISILGEEIGFIGLMIVGAIFVFVIYRGMRIALQASDKLGQIMAFGFTMVIALYGLMHAFVGTGLIPTTGIPLPFLSYGGMSLVFMMSSMGIVLNISSKTRPLAEVQKAFKGERISRIRESKVA
jgi:cell division protein FtsW